MEVILRAPLAEYLGADPATLGPDFRFAGKEFQGSVGMYKFMAFAKRRLGRPVPALPYGCTLAEAEALLAGAAEATQPVREAASVPSAPAANAAQLAVPEAVPVPSAPGQPAALRFAPAPLSPVPGPGVDLEAVQSMPEADDFRAHPFYRDTFTPAEIAYCVLKPDPREAFCGIFCAKEALLKADPASAGLPLNAIEIGHRSNGQPFYKRAGDRTAPAFDLSLSHAHGLAVAVAIARVPRSSPDTPASLAPALAPAPAGRRGRLLAVGVALSLIVSAAALIAVLAR